MFSSDKKKKTMKVKDIRNKRITACVSRVYMIVFKFVSRVINCYVYKANPKWLKLKFRLTGIELVGKVEGRKKKVLERFFSTQIKMDFL